MEGPILIVDDDPLFREALATALSLNGYRARVAGNGQEAHEAIQAERPSIILLDLSMPVLGGVGVLRELERRGMQVPVVVVTANDNGSAVAKEFGVAAYLQKPVALPRLIDAIAACGPARPDRRDTRGAA